MPHNWMLHITQIQLIPPHPNRLALPAPKNPGDLHRKPLEQRVRPKMIFLHHALEIHPLGQHVLDPTHRFAVWVVDLPADQPFEVDFTGAHW